MRRAGAWALALALAAAGPRGLRGEDLSAVVARYAGMAVAPNARAVRGATLTAGHLSATLDSGSVADVVAGGKTIGFFFRGSGRWRYVGTCPDEFAVVKRDVAKLGGWKAEESGGTLALSEGFDELLWLSPGGAGAPDGGAPAPDLAARFADHRRRFSAFQEDSVAQRLAERELSGSAAPLTWAEFRGGKRDVLYLFDGVEERDETISQLEEEEGVPAGRTPELFATPVSSQPIGRPYREAAPPLSALLAVEPTITADGEDAKVDVTETVDAIGESRRTLWWNLENRVFANGRDDVRQWTLERVSTEDGRSVPFDHRGEHVLLLLPDALVPGHPVRLRFELSGKILFRPGGDSYWLLGFDPWYPQPELSAQSFHWKCTMRVRKPFVPVASGREVARGSDGDWNTLTAEIDEPIYLPVALAGSYHIAQETIDGRVYRIASYAFTNATATKHLATLASQIVKFYEPFLGPFPWKEYTIVQIHALGFGVAPPATMFITDEAFTPHLDDLTQLFSQGLNERYAHEIAHQWWGIEIKWRGPLEQWLSESFAEYCAARLIEKERGRSYRKSLLADWRRISAAAGGHATIATANQLVGEGAFSDRFGLLYGKGPILLQAIEDEVGADTLLTSLKTFISNRKWRFETTADYAGLLKFLTKKDWGTFFDRYYWGTETPATR